MRIAYCDDETAQAVYVREVFIQFIIKAYKLRYTLAKV